MGRISLDDASDAGDVFWPRYMSDKLKEVVNDWVSRVERGGPNYGNWFGTKTPISTEHLRVAKSFLDSNPVD